MMSVLRPCFARTVEEHEAAFRLLYDSYFGAGFIGEDDSGLFIPPFLAVGDSPPRLRDCRVVVVWEPILSSLSELVLEAPLMTATLVPDDGEGLPCEEVFSKEVAALRRHGRLMEVTSLAGRGDSQFRLAAETLARLVIQYALVGDRFDALAIVVHPQHARYYGRRLAFKEASQVRSYDRLCSRPPGVLMVLAWKEALLAEPEKARRLAEARVSRECLENAPDASCREWLLRRLQRELQVA